MLEFYGALSKYLNDLGRRFIFFIHPLKIGRTGDPGHFVPPRHKILGPTVAKEAGEVHEEINRP